MPVFQADIDFEVYCSCGEGLCNQSDTGSRRGKLAVTIEPCEKCKGIEYDRGYEEGYKEGFGEREDGQRRD